MEDRNLLRIVPRIKIWIKKKKKNNVDYVWKRKKQNFEWFLAYCQNPSRSDSLASYIFCL